MPRGLIVYFSQAGSTGRAAEAIAAGLRAADYLIDLLNEPPEGQTTGSASGTQHADRRSILNDQQIPVGFKPLRLSWEQTSLRGSAGNMPSGGQSLKPPPLVVNMPTEGEYAHRR